MNYQAPLIKGDYKVYTDYRPSCQIIGMIMKQNEITNSYNLKKLLTDNALQFQDMNRKFYQSKVIDGQYYIPDPNNQLNAFEDYKDNLAKQVNASRCF